MTWRAVVAAAVLWPSLGWAHRLDEYLQATLLKVDRSQLQASIRLAPGVAVLPFILSTIDTDGDGVLSQTEQRAYAERVVGDLVARVDGEPLRLRLGAIQFPTLQELRDGLGEIRIEATAALPAPREQRTLVFENHHQSRIAVYLVNCLQPDAADIQIVGQKRNYDQSFYQVDFRQTGAGSSRATWLPWVVGAAALFLLARFVFLWRARLPFRIYY